MSVLGIHVKENPFYASYEDDCWVMLAKEIMAGYALSYSEAIPKTAMSQEEYDRLDAKSYVPIRRSILRNIKYGPLRNAMSIQSIYCGLEEKRKANLKRLGIMWKDSYNEDVTKI